MPNSDRIDRRKAKDAKPRKVRRVASPDRQPEPKVTKPRVVVARRNPDQAAPSTPASRKVEQRVQKQVRQGLAFKAAAKAAPQALANVETDRRRKAAKAKQSFLDRALDGIGTPYDGPKLTPKQIRMDTNRDGILSSGESNPKKLLKQQKVMAPALKVVSQTLRPVHGVAAGANAALDGQNPAPAAYKAVKTNKGPLFGDVYRKAGVPDSIAGPLGFVTDVGADPTTYVTFGAGSVASQSAAKASARALKKIEKHAADGVESAAARARAEATKKAASKSPEARKEAADTAEEQVREAAAERARSGAATAAKRAASKAKSGSGITIKFAGKEVPGVRAGTAASARTGGRVVRRVAPAPVKAAARKVRAVSRDGARDFRPSVAPTGVNPAEYTRVRDAAASARAQQQQARDFAQKVSRAVAKNVPDAKDQALVINAIETRSIKDLPERLRQPAKFIQSELRGARRDLRRSGVNVNDVERAAGAGNAKGYFPHALDDALRSGEGVVEGGGKKTVKLNATKKREDLRPIADINAQTPGKFSEDLPLILGNHFAQVGGAAAKARFNVALSRAGREVKWTGKPGNEVLDAKWADNEALYRINGANITEVTAKDVFKKGDGGRYFVLNKDLAESQLGTMRALEEKGVIERGLNKTTRVFKRTALATPAYHIRNAIGDTTMAYYAQPGHVLARNTGQAGKLLAADRRANKQIERLGFREVSGKTVKVNGKRLPVEQVLRTVKENGATQSGYIGRELDEVVGRKADGSMKRVPGAGFRPTVRGREVPLVRRVTTRTNIAAVKTGKALQARENLTRVSTAKHGLDRGLSGAEAGRLSRDAHIDYGDLSTLERRLRQGPVPFYTFAARNIPIQAKALVQRPGKIANFVKLREEAATSLGLQPGWENDLQEFQARQLVIPIGKSIGADGKPVVRVIDFGLPITSLNELPAGIDPVTYARELTTFGTSMLGPTFKIPFESAFNYDSFKRKPIVAADDPLRPAPSWAKLAGLTTDFEDPKTGKMVPGWSGTMAYIAKQLTPGPLGQAQQLTTKGTNTRGQAQGLEKAGSVLTGARIGYTNPNTARTSEIYDDLGEIGRRKKRLQQTKKWLDEDGFYTPEATEILADEKKLNDRKEKLSAEAGVPVKVRGKKRPLTPEQQVLKEIEDYRTGASAEATKQKVLDEIAKYKAGR